MKQFIVACIALLLLASCSKDTSRVIHVTGKVTSKINAEPVEGLTIALKKNSINNGWGVVQHTTTDSDGKFELFYGANAPGNYRVDVNSFPDRKYQCGNTEIEVMPGVVQDFTISIDTDNNLCQ